MWRLRLGRVEQHLRGGTGRHGERWGEMEAEMEAEMEGEMEAEMEAEMGDGGRSGEMHLE